MYLEVTNNSDGYIVFERYNTNDIEIAPLLRSRLQVENSSALLEDEITILSLQKIARAASFRSRITKPTTRLCSVK